MKGHGSSDAGDPDKRRNGDDWSGGEAGLPRDEDVGVAKGEATEGATGRAKSSRTKGRVQGWNSREERSC